jgi:hypothetical protein
MPTTPHVTKILFLAANPSTTTPLKLAEESREIDEALRAADFRDRFVVEQQWAVRADDLQKELLRHNPDIVHFSGHGSAAGAIIVEDEAGQMRPVSAAALGEMFALLKGNIRCVVLNACFSATQADAIAQHIDCVIGMSQAIGDKAAVEFATAFYQALGFGKDVKTAVDLGRNQINLEGLADSAVPQLLSQGDPSRVVFASDDAPEDDRDRRNNVAATWDWRKIPTRAWLALIGAVALVGIAAVARSALLIPPPNATPTLTLPPLQSPTVTASPTITPAPTGVFTIVDDYARYSADDLRAVYSVNSAWRANTATIGVSRQPGFDVMKLLYGITTLETDGTPTDYVMVERCFDPVVDWTGARRLRLWVKNDDVDKAIIVQFGEAPECPPVTTFRGEVWRASRRIKAGFEDEIVLELDDSRFQRAEAWSPRVNGRIDLDHIGYLAFGVGGLDQIGPGTVYFGPVKLEQ